MKTLLILPILLCSIAMAQTPKFTIDKSGKEMKIYFTASVIESTKRVIDTVYSTSDNKAFRVIQTNYYTFPDRELILIRYKEFWNEKIKNWSFFSVSLSPAEENTGISGSGLFIRPDNFSTQPNQYFNPR